MLLARRPSRLEQANRGLINAVGRSSDRFGFGGGVPYPITDGGIGDRRAVTTAVGITA
ncbi:hypothetical protein [Natronorubrum sulfidifaciens]|uniref:hypothetical protein n=1 Tax=Natronorubrum sulfidifaciens TaxID=388259 RepID=UPI000A532A2E|nr:hypothetical protein [Natronorubrum sulfidifaciens]